MKEANALEVTAIRAIETSDRARALWSDADRAWASRAAAEVVGERGSVDDFVAQNVYLYCAAAGLACVVRGLVDRRKLAPALKLRTDQRIVLAQTVGYPK